MENLVVVLMLVVQRRRLLIINGYNHLVFAFQTRRRLKYQQTENKVLKKDFPKHFNYTSLFNEKCFCSRTFSIFDCQSRILYFAN